jgi:pyruvate/2-oxoacid:ferredoxin oxidoreductase beta subunit
MIENLNKISRCVTHLKPEFTNIMSKETYTKKEYFKLFDSMDGKLSTLKLENEQLEFKMEEDKKIASAEFEDETKKLRELIKHERKKRTILETKILEMADEFIELSKRNYGHL